MVHPGDRKMVQQHVAKVLANVDVPPIEHRIIHRGGTTRWVRNTIFSHRDRTGRLVQYDGLIEDITQHKLDQERRRRDAEFLAARTIQEHLLPDGPPTLPGFDIAGMTYPAEFAAGDYFDYLPMRDGLVGFVVADVSGHGIGPAIFMAATQAYLRSLVVVHTELDEILKHANAILCREMKGDHFVTLLLAKLDPETRSLVYASAGHPTGYIIGSTGEVKAHLESTGLPLGILPDAIFSVRCPLALEPGDVVLLLTDGLLEARSAEDSLFGTERAIDVIRSNRDRTASEILASVYGAWREFSGRDESLDDITVVVIKVQPTR
jgi:sigma-B regulation protein RsbU (phosphoserine phosphatase)